MIERLPNSNDLSYWNRPTRQLLMELGDKVNELVAEVEVLIRRFGNLRDCVLGEAGFGDHYRILRDGDGNFLGVEEKGDAEGLREDP